VVEADGIVVTYREIEPRTPAGDDQGKLTASGRPRRGKDEDQERGTRRGTKGGDLLPKLPAKLRSLNYHPRAPNRLSVLAGKKVRRGRIT
jgi:hypothetical protein